MAIKGYIATSADGYIATPDGGVDFLNDFQYIDCGYDRFVASIQTIVMGRKTYETICGFDVPWPYPNQKTWVITSQKDLPIVDESIQFWHSELADLVTKLQEPIYGDTWVVGGAQLQSAFIEHNYLDCLEVYIMPILLGDGISLFPKTKVKQQILAKIEASTINNTVIKQIYHF